MQKQILKIYLMPIRYFSLLTAIFVTVILCAGCRPDNYVRIEGYAQGGTWHVICNLPGGLSEQDAKALIDGALEEMDRSLSGYNKGSLLSRINAGEDLPLDSLFIGCFLRSKEIWEISGGAFDPSAAPLFDLWGFGFEDRGAVSQTAIDSILSFVGMESVSLEERPDGVHLCRRDPRTKLNFNAIAQGYTCDVVASRLRAAGCEDYLVEVGREIVCKGRSSRGGKWKIGIDKPYDGNFSEGESLQDILEVTDCGIVTSGNYRKYYVVDGQKFAHTIDPRTGYPVQHNLLSATVISSDATSADALATWAMVEGVGNAGRFLDTIPETGAYLIYSEGDSMKVYLKRLPTHFSSESVQ